MNRDDFPILNSHKDLVYFDNGATTLKPKQVITGVVDYYSNYTANAHRGDYDNSVEVDQRYEGVREKVKKLLNAEKSSEIIFTKGTTDSLNMIVFGFMKYYLNNGDEVIISRSEHASNVLPWLELANIVGIKIKYIPLEENFTVNIDNINSRTGSFTLFNNKTIAIEQQPYIGQYGPIRNPLLTSSLSSINVTIISINHPSIEYVRNNKNNILILIIFSLFSYFV